MGWGGDEDFAHHVGVLLIAAHEPDHALSIAFSIPPRKRSRHQFLERSMLC
jgi:hypothetical protein